MNNQFHKICGVKKVVIGAIHFPPLLGFLEFPGFEVALKNALADLQALEEGGVTAIVFENNYDIPHTEFVTPEVIASMTYLGEKIKNATSLPVGISVLWNDYKTGFAIAKILGLQFIRIPVLVDTVETSYGIINGDAGAVALYRASIGAEDIMLFSDIHVKHSTILSPHSITESAQLAIDNGADAVIVTGRWTGDSPDVNELKEVRTIVGDFPILIGSGVDKNNIKQLFEFADGTIVSTSLKEGGTKTGEVNVKGYEQRINVNKVRELMAFV